MFNIEYLGIYIRPMGNIFNRDVQVFPLGRQNTLDPSLDVGSILFTPPI